MPDEAPSTTAQYNSKIWAAGIGAGFAFAVIVYLLIAGKSGNRLHETAMIWAWVTVIGVLAGFGIGATLGPITEIFTKH